jgi:DNA-binding MarR family transcriptional regulator
MIVRKIDKTDKRKVKICLTDKGKKNKELAKNIVRKFNSLVEDKIGKKRKDDFFKTITEIAQLAEDRHKIIKKD